MIGSKQESEPAKNNAAPAVIFKTGSDSSHFKKEKQIGGNFYIFQENYIFSKLIRLL